MRLPWILSVILAALLLAYCADNRIAGGSSSGVDNPSLTVGFVDASGAALRVSGDLDIYAADQNPAVDPEPLVTLKVKNSAFTNLTGSDFERLLAPAVGKQAPGSLSKFSEDGPAIAADSAVTFFNIMLRTKDRKGSLAFGFRYDSVANTFTRTDEVAALKRFDMRPKPLVRYAARISREPVHGEDGRVFVPGTPFLAALVDSAFVLENMPEGLFPLRFLAGDGKIYAVADSLNTLDSTLVYRPRPTPLGSVDTAGQDSVPDFTIHAGDEIQAYIGSIALLNGKITGASPADPRLTVTWLQRMGPANPIPGDTVPRPPNPPKPDTAMSRAIILNSSSLVSGVEFSREGHYVFELKATIGIRTQVDTVSVYVHKNPPPAPRIVFPLPGDSLRTDSSYNVHWEMPDSGPVTVSLSLDSGRAWIELATGYTVAGKHTVYPWIPAEELGSSDKCLLRVRSDADSTRQAEMDGAFRLVR